MAKTKLVNGQGDEIVSNTDLGKEIESVKASSRTRSHLIAPGNVARTFDSIEDMNAQAEEALSMRDKDYLKEVEEDKLNGFDINDINSIINFDIEYAPIGSTILVKFLREDKLGSTIILLDSSSESKKALVVEVGMFVDYIKKGDIISVRGQDSRNPLPPSIERTFKGVKLKEINYESVTGIYMKKQELIKRNLADMKQRRLEEGA